MLLKEAKNESAFLKMGIYGEAASGKTYTSSKIAMGLHKFIKGDKKAVAFLDTETGSDFMIPVFKREKIKLVVAKTRAFKDTLEIIDEAEKNCAILIIDSITHIWNEMTDSYCKQHKIPKVTLPHWQPVKRIWRDYTDRFINSKLHIIMAGRSADKWQHIEDEEGVKELQKVGTKMRGETQIGYEPNLLVEMEQVHKSPRVGSGWIHRVWIIKDRWNEETKLEGMNFDNPTFKSFLPHVELLNIGGKHRALDTSRTSDELFEKGETGFDRHRKRQGVLEDIKAEIHLLYPGQNSDSKTNRIELMKKIFGTASWTNIESMRNEDLENGLTTIKKQSKKEGKSNDKTTDVSA